MRALVLLLAGCLVFPTLGHSQKLKLELTSDREHYLAGETISLTLRVSNFSGRPLILGLDQEWLSFSITGPNRKSLDRLQELGVKGPFSIPSGGVVARTYELSSSFDFSQTGPYAVLASVQIKDWNEAFKTAAPKKVEILRGIKIVDQEVGLPVNTGAANSPPESRRYSLLQVRQGQNLYLYFRLTDASGAKILQVFPLGPLVNFGKPEYQIDRHSFLHVLFQSNARTFTYCALKTSGDIFIRQTHELVTNRPNLTPDRDGDILITGGVRRFRPTDIPPSTMLTKPTDESPDKPAPPPAPAKPTRPE